MPYIDQESRKVWDDDYFADAIEGVSTPGELNYFISQIIGHYLLENGIRYQTMNDVVGALDNAKDEFKRRIQDKYEDKKIAENGDVDVYAEIIKKMEES